ncbi:MFS transporter [Nostoc sp. ChiQUE01b]|uniref:MFS transporter n=1 Tax=Nostoc sp. ChiQUE01b TaxID=3075376 RepID=UPI002AD44861|nr:MFS transporter [Nostoc sp. ChiQUE01b]MDZ8260806.1 MFS transporter [Nostoc sp. ChiQUE01b]
MSLTPSLRSFKSRNFCLFFTGQSFSMIGSFMTETTFAWLVYSETESVALLGLIGFLSQVPNLIVSPLAGIWIEQFNRRTILITVQSIMMLLSLTLSIFALTGTISIWQIICASIVQGLLSSVETPCRYTFIMDIIEKKEDIINATSLHSSLLSGSRIIAPAIAGIIIANFSAGHCFLIDAISYIAIILALLAIETNKLTILHQNNQHNHWENLKVGFLYAYNFLPIRSILLLIALLSFLGMPYLRIMPVFAIQTLQGDSTTLGFLTGASGLGALCGGIYLSFQTSVVKLNKIIALAPAIFGISLIIFSLSRNFWFSLMIVPIIGCTYILEYSASSSILQIISNDENRGRLMSIYNMSVMGIIPFGNLFISGLANIFNATNALIFGGLCCISGSIIFYKNLPNIEKILQPIYFDKGMFQK